jgi:hypothetical protein
MSEVSSFIAQQLKDMGFEDARIQKALKATKATSVETVMEWLISHEGESDDEPEATGNTLTLRPDAADATVAEPEKVKTAEEVEEAKRRYNELIVKRRQEREAKEKEEEIEREKNRRKTGSDIIRLKEKVQQDERIAEAAARRREKEEDKIVRQRVLDQIKSDREAFNRRNNPNSAPAEVVAVPPAPVAVLPPVNHDSCRMAIRLPDGSNIVNTFQAKEQLAAVRLYVQLHRKDPLPPGTLPSNFNLQMPPSPPFSEEDMERPLIDLGLCPSARLIVSQRK